MVLPLGRQTLEESVPLCILIQRILPINLQSRFSYHHGHLTDKEDYKI